VRQLTGIYIASFGEKTVFIEEFPEWKHTRQTERFLVIKVEEMPRELLDEELIAFAAKALQ